MTFVDGFVAAVPKASKDAYLAFAQLTVPVFKRHGALAVTECWGEDVPGGELTSFPMAVKATEEEAVVFSWISWPSREARDAGWAAAMPEMEAIMKEQGGEMPFDGKRMIYGGFQMILDA